MITQIPHNPRVLLLESGLNRDSTDPSSIGHAIAIRAGTDANAGYIARS